MRPQFNPLIALHFYFKIITLDSHLNPVKYHIKFKQKNFFLSETMFFNLLIAIQFKSGFFTRDELE